MKSAPTLTSFSTGLSGIISVKFHYFWKIMHGIQVLS